MSSNIVPTGDKSMFPARPGEVVYCNYLQTLPILPVEELLFALLAHPRRGSEVLFGWK